MTFKRIATGTRARTRPRSTRMIATLVAGASGVAMATLAGLAAAASPSTLGTTNNSMLGETIVVDSHALTVYELRPESAHHLLCSKANRCFQIWRPLTVASAKTKLIATHGVTGKLRILHRGGIFQVTLSGHPLYRFVGDSSHKGVATGDGIRSFHGTWHVVAASSSASAAPVTTTTMTMPTMTTPTTPTTTTPTTPTTPYNPLLPPLY